MQEQEYESNSFKSKEESVSTQEKKTGKIISGTVKKKKKSDVKKFLDVFIPEDIPNVKNRIFSTIITPAIKRIIDDGIDTIAEGVRTFFLGEDYRPSNKQTTTNTISYRNYYDKSRTKIYPTEQDCVSRKLDDLIFQSRRDVEEILLTLEEDINRYGIVSVADLYDLCGISHSYTDNNYGWTEVSDWEIVRTRNGFRLKIPRAMPID